MSFLYVEEPHALGILPQLGPVGGGTLVTIYGHQLLATPPLSCCFETAYHMYMYMSCTMGRSVSATQLECVTPQLHGDQPLPSSVHVVFTSGRRSKPASTLLRYTFHRHVRVLLPRPHHGPILGGTLVRVHGVFDLRATQQSMSSCSFNTTRVVASWVSDQVMNPRTDKPSHLVISRLKCLTRCAFAILGR